MPLAAPAGVAARPAIGAVATGDWENDGQLLTAIAGNHVVLAATPAHNSPQLIASNLAEGIVKLFEVILLSTYAIITATTEVH